MNVAKLSLCAAFLFSLFSIAARAQISERSSDSFDERSNVFALPFDPSEENALDQFRFQHLPQFSAEQLAKLQMADGQDYGVEDRLLALNIFGSLAAYY